MVNFTFAGEATNLYNKILGWNTLAAAQTMIYGAVPASHIELVNINKRVNVSYPREFENMGGRTRFFVNKGESNPVTPEHRNVPATTVTAKPRILESINKNNNEYNTMDFDELTHKPYSSGLAHYMNFLETQARNVMPQIDLNYFATFTEEQLIDGITPKDGFTDGVTEYTITTDLTVASEATANALVYELMTRINVLKERASGNTLDNFIIHVPLKVIAYLRSNFNRAVVRSYHPVDATHSGQKYNPAAAVDLDGVLCVGYTTEVLGTSTVPAGEYGYLNSREAIKTVFEDRNDPAFAVQNMTAPTETFFNAIVSELNATGMQYDNYSRKLIADLKANKGFMQEGSMIPGNIFRVKLYHLGSDCDNFGSRIDVVERPTRLMPKGMERLIFEDALLPTASQHKLNEQKALERESKLQSEVNELKAQIEELKQLVKNTAPVMEESPAANRALNIQKKEEKRLNELKSEISKNAG